MHSLSGLTPTVASAHLPALPLPDSKVIYYSFTLQGNRHTHFIPALGHTHTTHATIRMFPKLMLFLVLYLLESVHELFLTYTEMFVFYQLKIALACLCFSKLDRYVWMYSSQASRNHNYIRALHTGRRRIT